jgi:molecular chaperone DnaK
MAADNRSLARFELTGIPPAPRGVPKILVTFRIDANGVASVEAKDAATSRAQTTKVVPSSGLNQDEVDRLVEEADRFKFADALRSEMAELRNQAATLLYTTEQAIDGYKNLVDEAAIGRTLAAAAELRSLLETQGDIVSIREAYQQLEGETFAIAERLYGAPNSDTNEPNG